MHSRAHYEITSLTLITKKKTKTLDTFKILYNTQCFEKLKTLESIIIQRKQHT